MSKCNRELRKENIPTPPQCEYCRGGQCMLIEPDETLTKDLSLEDFPKILDVKEGFIGFPDRAL